MSTTAPAPAASTRLSSRVVLDRAVAAMSAKRRVEVEVLESALAWAEAHVVSDEQMAAITALDRGERTGPDPDTFNYVP